jgi:hypothetical protein
MWFHSTGVVLISWQSIRHHRPLSTWAIWPERRLSSG